jgi:hypothetical protein
MGSATGEAMGSAAASSGLPGEGGGSFGGFATSVDTRPPGVDGNAFGGGTTAPTAGSGALAEMKMEGLGGGSV